MHSNCRGQEERAIARVDDFVKLLPEPFLNRSGSVFFSGRRASYELTDLYVLGRPESRRWPCVAEYHQAECL